MGTSFLNIYRGFFIANLRVLLGPGNKNNTTNSDGSIHHHSDPKIVRKQFWSNYLSAATLKMPMDGGGAHDCHLPHDSLSCWVVVVAVSPLQSGSSITGCTQPSI